MSNDEADALREELRHAYDNLTAVQTRCTELTEETRRLRALLNVDEPFVQLALLSERAVETFGADYELRKFIEECSEGSVEASKYLDHRSSADKLASEAADVIITAFHVRHVLPAGLVDKYLREKRDRLCTRIIETTGEVVDA